MNFQDFEYIRPNIKEYQETAKKILENIGTNKSLEVELEAINQLNKLNDEIESLASIAAIRHDINTKDEFYTSEQEFLDENMPYLQEISNEYINKLLGSSNRELLEEKLGNLVFLQAEVARKTFKPEIIEKLQLENKLSSEYGKLTAGAEILFDGNIYNLSQMAPFTQSTDRETRKKASLAVSKFFNDNILEYDRIYDQLVRVRHEIALELGYENFIQLGYDRFGRTDYTKTEVAEYRRQIFKDVVPFVNELTERKAERLNITNPQSYDLALSFLSGNPTPKGDRAWQVDKALKMYGEMS